MEYKILISTIAYIESDDEANIPEKALEYLETLRWSSIEPMNGILIL